MKILKVLLIAVLLIGTVQMASAENTNAGILPDNLLYSIDIAIEKIDLALTFSDEEMISKELEFAKERLSEARFMAENGNLNAMKETEEEHGRLLTDVKNRIKNIDGDPSRLHVYLQSEKEFEEYKLAAEEELQKMDLKEMSSVTIEGDGKLTQEQIDQIKLIISNLKGQSGETETEVNNEKTKIKIKIKNKTGKSDQEIEAEVEKIEDEVGLRDVQKEFAPRLIADLRNEYNETVSEAKSAGVSIPSEKIKAFESSLARAISEYNNGNYGKSTQLSNEASFELERIKGWMEEDAGLREEQKQDTQKLIAELREKFNEIISEARSAGVSVPSAKIDAFESSLARAISEYNNGNHSESIRLSNEASFELERIKGWINNPQESLEWESQNQTEVNSTP